MNLNELSACLLSPSISFCQDMGENVVHMKGLINTEDCPSTVASVNIRCKLRKVVMEESWLDIFPICEHAAVILRCL